MKISEFKKLIREEVRKVLREDYLKQNNIFIDEFTKLSATDYKNLTTLIQQFDKMQEADESLFEFTSDYVDSESFSDIVGYELFYSTIAKKGKAKFPKAATVAAAITAILQKAI